MRKSLVAILIVILTTSLLVACSSEPRLVITDTSIEMTSNNFTGTESHTVSLAAGSELTFSIDSRRGSLDIIVSDEAGYFVQGGQGIEGRGLSFTISADGEHTIAITGHSYSGSVKVNWE